MATVNATAITRIHNVEGALTLTSIGGGAGGAANTEIFIQGTQSAGRKQSNAADHGFWLTVGSQDVSPAGTHVGVWVNHVHYAVLTLLRVRLGSTIGAATAGNWDGHNIPLTEYPATGGWIRAWFDVDRTPEATGDSGALVQTALIGVAVVASLPAVGGNAPNIIMDASDFTTTGLLLTGTTGVWNDFVSADEGNGTNKYGVVVTKASIIYCLARLTLGSASSLVFDDSSFVIVFPQQATVADTFMGITLDLQNAATDIAWANATVKSAGAKKGDLVVTGTSGIFDVSNSTLASLRIITLTSKCTLTGCLISGCGLVTIADGKILSSTILGSTSTPALSWNTATDPSGNLDSTTFVSPGTGHAIEFGTNTPGDPTEISLVGVIFTGYGGTPGSNLIENSGSTDAAIHNSSGKHLIINITGGGTTPAVRNSGTGSTTTIVSGTVTVMVTVKNEAGSPIVGARVSVRKVSDNTEVVGGDTDVNGVVSGSATASLGAVSVRVRKGSGGVDYVPVDSPQTIGASAFAVTITMAEDTVNTL